MTETVVRDDNAVALPEWLIDAPGLAEGDEIEFLKVPEREQFWLRKVPREAEDSGDDRNHP